MVPSRYRVFLWAGPVVVGTWLAVAFSDENPQNSVVQWIFAGLFWGTLFGHSTLAAAWSAFGPAPFLVRVPLAFVWVATLPFAIAIHLEVNSGPREFAVPIAASFLGQWLVLLFPFWGLALGMGLRLQHDSDTEQQLGRDTPQFTIRQLIVLTVVVGLLFGIGRLVFPEIVEFGRDRKVFFGLLAATQVVLTLPLVLAALIRRFTIPGIVLMLVLISTATVWQTPVLALDSTTSVPFHLLVTINVSTALIILLVLTIVRLNGYSLVATRSAKS